MRLIKIYTGILLWLFAGNLLADQKIPFELPRSEVISIPDRKNDRVYEIHIQLPAKYQEDKKYPVVYMTDSPYTFPIVTGAARYPVNNERMRDVMFVGISWQTGYSPAASRRRDYTPTVDALWANDPAAEADKHLEFIRNEVIPYIDTRFSTDITNRTYVGNSLGGLFGFYILLNNPYLFKNYVIGSPSVWWGEKHILAAEAKTKLPADLAVNIFIAVGADEIPGRDSPKNDMVGQAREMFDRLKARDLKNSKFEMRVIEHANHATAFPVTSAQGLWWLFNNDTGDKRGVANPEP